MKMSFTRAARQDSVVFLFRSPEYKCVHGARERERFVILVALAAAKKRSGFYKQDCLCFPSTALGEGKEKQQAVRPHSETDATARTAACSLAGDDVQRKLLLVASLLALVFCFPVMVLEGPPHEDIDITQPLSNHKMKPRTPQQQQETKTHALRKTNRHICHSSSSCLLQLPHLLWTRRRA